MEYFWQGPMPLAWWIALYQARSVEARRREARYARQLSLI